MCALDEVALSAGLFTEGFPLDRKHVPEQGYKHEKPDEEKK